jgi:hypothetical protein
MKEDILDTLRQQDTNLREAIHEEEKALPQMPADLNARLMQRVESGRSARKRRIIWPWIAAACVTALIAVYLTPPKAVAPQQDVVAKVELKAEEHVANSQESRLSDISSVTTIEDAPQATAAPAKHKHVASKQSDVIDKEPLLAQETTETAHAEEMPIHTEETASTTLTERDIPITRPENLKYTPEEIALMKQQATEAYLKWVQLELEISKYNLEQTAQQ